MSVSSAVSVWEIMSLFSALLSKFMLVKKAAFGVIFLNLIFSLLKKQQYLIQNFWYNNYQPVFLAFCCSKSSFFGCLKLIFFKISGSVDFLDLFHWQNLLVTATLLSCNWVQASNLNNKAATWLHAEPRLKIEIEKIK